MAITDVFNSLTFGGVNSLDYGVYISGPGVYNAPTRDVEFVSVPGRNGAIEIDRGHWNNIEVTYNAGTFGENKAEFAQNVSRFRNAILSQIGYQRLSDTYNPEEYRLGLYASGLEVSAVNMNEAGEFELVFNCKPQRFLLSGESAVAVTSGGTIENPTLLDSSPLLLLQGRGNISINDVSLNFSSTNLGEIKLADGFAIKEDASNETHYYYVPGKNDAAMQTGDVVYVEPISFTAEIERENDIVSYEIALSNIPLESWNVVRTSSKSLLVYGTTKRLEGEYNTEAIKRSQISIRTIESTSATSTTYLSIGFVTYNWADAVGRVDISNDVPIAASIGKIIGVSSLGSDDYVTEFDTAVGEAYTTLGGQSYSLNENVVVRELPRLKPGENNVVFDNTITDLEIKPRWWEL